MLADLESGKNALLDVLSGVTEETAAKSPAPGKWSVLECVEHLAVSEDYLLSQIGAAYNSPEAAAIKGREPLIRARGADRTRTVQAPAVASPAGRFSTLREAMEHFFAIREKTMHLVRNCGEDLRAKLTSHPIIGTVNCYETLLMIAIHTRRHVEQIEEIKKEFPPIL